MYRRFESYHPSHMLHDTDRESLKNKRGDASPETDVSRPCPTGAQGMTQVRVPMSAPRSASASGARSPRRYDSSPTVFLSAIAPAATVIFWLRVLSLATKSIPECPVETGAGTTSQTAEWPKLSTLRMGKGSDITHRSDRYPDDRHSCRVSLQCGTRNCAFDCHFHHIFPDFSLLTLTP